jgi:hypothetical protein
MTTLINITNEKLNNWYKNAKIDYNVIGSGFLTIENNTATINFTENGVSKTWSMPFYPEYAEFGNDYIFNVWMEEAN